MRGPRKLLFVIILLNIIGHAVVAQHDTSYFVSYTDKITSRFYFAKKYTSFNYRNLEEAFNLNYRPNTSLNMGVGATYKWATLNLAYGFDFLNPDKGQGDTDYLDLQLHAYGNKFTVDFLGQLYKGFFLTPRGKATSGDDYYVRPDMVILATGLSAQYVLNHDKFSYQAAFHQSQWQKKSAGSFLFGFETYLGRIRADSSLVPQVVNPTAAAENIDHIHFYEFGPNVGYAYSLIIKKNFFATASATVSIDYGKTTIERDAKNTQYKGLSPNLLLRTFCGYNSDLWGVSFVYIHSAVNLSASHSPNHIVLLNTGNFRFNIIRRFSPGKKTKKVLKPIDKIHNKFK